MGARFDGPGKRKDYVMVRTMVFASVAAGVLLFAVHEYGMAQPGPVVGSSEIGIVRVRQAFRECERNRRYRAESLAEQSRANAEEEELSKTIGALEAGLKALRPGGADYMAQVKELFEKQASLKAMQEFNKRQSLLKDQLWTEALYKETLEVIASLAKQKRLSVVFEVDEPEFPFGSGEQLMMSIQTHKVLYSAGCRDLTAEVVAELDKNDSTKK